MLLTPLDLLFLAASSPAAQKAERDRVLATLTTLRAGLTGMSDQSATAAGAAMFSNAASDLFCHLRVARPDPRDQFESLASLVERALGKLSRHALAPEEVASMVSHIDLVLASMQQHTCQPSAKDVG